MIILHHLASSGGTVFAKALIAQGNCALLNEVHPYFSVLPDAAFSPTTPLEQYLWRYSKELSADKIAEARQELFRFQLKYIHEQTGHEKNLLVREWSHGDFISSDRFSSSVLPLLDFAKPVSLVLLRHPIDIFLSGKTYNAWNPIRSDINEFCRRYCKFCDFFLRRPATHIIKYEDFVAKPDELLNETCEKLGLTFNPHYMLQLNQFRLSGASGRTAYDKIVPRPRRPMSIAEQNAFQQSEYFHNACELGGFESPGSRQKQAMEGSGTPISLKRTVRERGILASGGTHVDCVVEATEVSNQAGGPPIYAEIKIAEVGALLPSGDYDLLAFGGKHLMRRSNGRWIALLSY